MEKKKCLECGEPITGRTDKKYCSDACRNAYNNRQNNQNYNLIRRINRILAKNHKILSETNKKGKTTKSRSELLEKGFNFHYFTSLYTTKEMKQYFFCYDQGYLELKNEKYLLVKREN